MAFGTYAADFGESCNGCVFILSRHNQIPEFTAGQSLFRIVVGDGNVAECVSPSLQHTDIPEELVLCIRKSFQLTGNTTGTGLTDRTEISLCAFNALCCITKRCAAVLKLSGALLDLFSIYDQEIIRAGTACGEFCRFCSHDFAPYAVLSTLPLLFIAQYPCFQTRDTRVKRNFVSSSNTRDFQSWVLRTGLENES